MSFCSLSHEKRKECYCGYDVTVQRGWTTNNPSRRFVACPDYDVHNNTMGCNYFRWVDDNMTDWQKDVILKLIEERSKLQREGEIFQRKLELANKKIRKTTSDRIMMKMLYPQRVWRCGLIMNCIVVVLVLSWLISYFI